MIDLNTKTTKVTLETRELPFKVTFEQDIKICCSQIWSRIKRLCGDLQKDLLNICSTPTEIVNLVLSSSWNWALGAFQVDADDLWHMEREKKHKKPLKKVSPKWWLDTLHNTEMIIYTELFLAQHFLTAKKDLVDFSVLLLTEKRQFKRSDHEIKFVMFKSCKASFRAGTVDAHLHWSFFVLFYSFWS